MIFGFLGQRPAELVAWRAPLFQAAGHHYEQQRRIVDSRPRGDAAAHSRRGPGPLGTGDPCWRSSCLDDGCWRVEPTMTQLEIAARGIRFRALERPGPTPVVPCFLHGFPQTSWSWHHQLEAVAAAGIAALAFDQRGYSPGARPPAVDDYLLERIRRRRHSRGRRTSAWRASTWSAMTGVPWWRGRWRLLTPTGCARSPPCRCPIPARVRASVLRRWGCRPGGPLVVHRGLPGRRRGGRAALLGEDGSGAGLHAMFDQPACPSDTRGRRLRGRHGGAGALTAALNWYRAMSAEQTQPVGAVTVPTLYVWSDGDMALGRRAAEAHGGWVTGPVPLRGP